MGLRFGLRQEERDILDSGDESRFDSQTTKPHGESLVRMLAGRSKCMQEGKEMLLYADTDAGTSIILTMHVSFDGHIFAAIKAEHFDEAGNNIAAVSQFELRSVGATSTVGVRNLREADYGVVSVFPFGDRVKAGPHRSIELWRCEPSPTDVDARVFLADIVMDRNGILLRETVSIPIEIFFDRAGSMKILRTWFPTGTLDQ